MTSGPTVRPRPSSSPTTPRSCATASRRRSRRPATGRSPCGAPPSCWHACAPTSTTSIWSSLDLRLPHTRRASSSCAACARSTRAGCRSLVFSGTIASADEVRELAALGVAGYVNEYSAVQHILPSLAPHLFPDSFNRRGSPRVVLGIPIAYRFGNTIAAALTLNLSRGGIAVRTTSPLEAGAQGASALPPARRQDATSTSRPAWPGATAASGMGLQFERVDAPRPGRPSTSSSTRISSPIAGPEPRNLHRPGSAIRYSPARGVRMTRTCRSRRSA